MSGEYRTFYTEILDKDWFLSLSPNAKSLWLVMRLKLGRYGFGRINKVIASTYAGFNVTEFPEIVAELENSEPVLLRFHKDICWCVGAIDHEPSFSFKNEKHVSGLLKYLESFGDSPMVQEFLQFHGLNRKSGDSNRNPGPDGNNGGVCAQAGCKVAVDDGRLVCEWHEQVIAGKLLSDPPGFIKWYEKTSQTGHPVQMYGDRGHSESAIERYINNSGWSRNND